MLNSRKAATFSEATSVKDVKVTDETFVVELLATTVTPGTRTETFTLDGDTRPSPVTDKTAA